MNYADGTVSVLVNTFDPNDPNAAWYAPAVNLPVREPPLGSEPRSLTLIDLDEDGDRDIVVIAKNEDNAVVARVLRNDLSGGQLAFAPAADLDAGQNPVAVTKGDLNGDGREDLIAISGSAGDSGRAGNVVIRLNQREQAPVVPGDLDCSGAVDFDDINPFVLALSTPAGYAAQYPECNILNGDCDSDGDVDFDDINPFIAILSGGLDWLGVGALDAFR